MRVKNIKYVLLHILIMLSCGKIANSYAQQQADGIGNFVNIGYGQKSADKKFVSINQTEEDSIAKVANSNQQVFTPQPTIASQRAGISNYSSANYNNRKSQSSINSSAETYSAVNTIKNPSNSNIQSNQNIANSSSVSGSSLSNSSYKNYTNIKSTSNDANYSVNTSSNYNSYASSQSNQLKTTATPNSNDYQQDAVIPFIVDSVQYKNKQSQYYTDGNQYANNRNSNTSTNSNKYNNNSTSTSNLNYPDNNSNSNNASYSNNNAISNVISTYNKSIPKNINNQNAWLAVDNATNNANFSTYYKTLSNAAGILLNNAKSLIGIPYRYGGNTPNDGLDCSGFVRYVFYYTLGIALPRRSAEIGQLGMSIESSSLKEGDLVFFNTRGRLSHLGIYMGNGSFIHAPSTGSRIRIDSLSSKYWSSRYEGAKRLVSLE
ncbi:MAG: hypothetical protein RLZZ210_846 [Pseudomonadota bacterium]